MKQNKLKKHNTNLFTVSALIIIVALIVIAGVALYQQFNSSEQNRVEYEGRVLDKSITIKESETGSYPIKKLYIRNRNNEEFNVLVDAKLYDRVKVGMWIKKDRDDVILSTENSE